MDKKVSGNQKTNSILKIGNISTLEEITECNLCYNQFDSEFHQPLVLTCGHNICQISVEKLFINNEIDCPFCKVVSSYENISLIPKNYSMLQVIQLQEKQAAFIQVQLSSEKSGNKNPIQNLIDKIKRENNRIKNLKNSIEKRLKSFITFNDDLIHQLEIYFTKVQIDLKKVLKQPIDNESSLKQFGDQLSFCQKLLGQKQSYFEKVEQNCQFVKYDDVVMSIVQETREESDNVLIDLENLRNSNLINKDEVVQDYITLCNVVQEYILKQKISTKNFIIKKQKNMIEIIEILQKNSFKNIPEALNTLGFLYYKGINVEESISMAYKYFKRSARQGNLGANFICYFLSESISEKYDFFENGIINQYPKVLEQLGYLIESDKLTDLHTRNKIAISLYKASAQKDISQSMYDYAMCLKQGIGVELNLDKSAELFFKAMEAGHLEAKMELDSILPHISGTFMTKHPDYMALQSKNYEEYESQEIILL